MFAAFVPPKVVTSTLAVPAALPAGVVQVAVVALVTLKLTQATPPTVIAVAPDRSLPVIVIAVPPDRTPLEGETDVTVGTGNVATNTPNDLGLGPTVTVETTVFVAVLITDTLLD